MFTHAESQEGKCITLLGKSLPGPPEDQVYCRQCRPRGCTDGYHMWPPACQDASSSAAQPVHGQAHGSWVVSPGWDREFPALTSAPKPELYEQHGHKPSQGTSLVIPPSNLPALFFSLRYA